MLKSEQIIELSSILIIHNEIQLTNAVVGGFLPDQDGLAVVAGLDGSSALVVAVVDVPNAGGLVIGPLAGSSGALFNVDSAGAVCLEGAGVAAGVLPGADDSLGGIAAAAGDQGQSQNQDQSKCDDSLHDRYLS